MNSNLTFILKLSDLLTPAMRNAAAASSSAASKIQTGFDGVQYKSKQMSASLQENYRRLEMLKDIRFSTKIQAEFDQATKAANKLQKEIDKMEGNNGGKGGGLSMGGLIKGNLITGAITEGIGMVKDFAVDAYRTSLKSSSLKTAINSTTGGQGGEAVRQTDFIANKYGLDYESSLEGVKTLTGGLKSMNMPLAEQMKIFEGVSTGIAAMKLGAEEGKGAMLALGQMASKGTVSAEELRGQLGERIPSAFGIAAKAMNMTEAQLGKMMQKGEIAAKDFLPKFAAEMQKSFGADALAAANGPEAVQKRFNNAIFKMKAEIGDGFMPLLTPLIVSFTNLATTIIPYIQIGIKFISDTLGAAFSTVMSLSGGSGEWGSYISVIQETIGHVWNTFKSLLGNVWAIVSGIITFIGKSELLKDVFWAIGKIMSGIWDVVGWIGDKIQWVWDNVISPILNAVDIFYSATKGLFVGGKSTVEIVAKQAPVTPTSLPNQPQLLGVGGFLQAPVVGLPQGVPTTNPVDLNGIKTGNGTVKELASNGKIKEKTDSINSGGQRSIVINIGKQIERLEFTVMDAKESADKIEAVVRESIRRVIYSLNGVAAG